MWFLICSMSFSLLIAITLLSLLCLRRILPLLVQMYLQLNFFLSSLAKENKCLFLFVRFSNHQVQCNIPTFEALLRKYKHLFLERCRKSNNILLRALMHSDYLYSSLSFEHYNRILLCEWVIVLCSIRLIDGVSCHNAFAFYLDSTNLRIEALLRSSFVTSVTC